MTIRSITPPPGEDWTKWHAARDREVRHALLDKLASLLEYDTEHAGAHCDNDQVVSEASWRDTIKILRDAP